MDKTNQLLIKISPRDAHDIPELTNQQAGWQLAYNQITLPLRWKEPINLPAKTAAQVTFLNRN